MSSLGFKTVILSLVLVTWSVEKARGMNSIISTSNFQSTSSGSVIPEGYSPVSPPPTADGPTKVAFSVVIMNVRDINEQSQEVSLEMNLRLHWKDSRLENRTGTDEYWVISPGLMDKELWHPDIFIDRVKDVKSPLLVSKPASLRLHSDGRLRYSTRVTAVMSCHMNFQYYPVDVQNCNVDLKTYAYPMSILILAWHEGVSASFDGIFTLPNFNLALQNPGVFTTNSSSGTYSGIRFTISLQRRLSYHLLQTYVPSTLLIFVSWFTLIIPQDNGAVAISMTLLLTTVTMFATIRQNSPNVSYVKAIDIWMVVCLFLVFLSFAQHSLTIRMRHMRFASKASGKRNEKQKQIVSSSHDQTAHDPPPLDDDPSVLGVAYRLCGKDSLQRGLHPVETSERQVSDISKRYAKDPQNFDTPPPGPPPPPPSPKDDPEVTTKKVIDEYKILGNQVRKIYGLALPIFFLLFNLFYWPWLLNSSEFKQ